MGRSAKRDSGAARLMLAAVLCAAAAALTPSAAISEDCRDIVSADCATRYGAGAIAPQGDEAERCGEELEAFRSCLGALISTAPEPAPVGGTAPCDAETARLLWTEVAREGGCLGYAVFLEACPSSPFGRLAEARRSNLRCDEAKAASPSPAVAPDSAAKTPPASTAPRPQGSSAGPTLIAPPFKEPILVRRGSQICAAETPDACVTITDVRRPGVAYRNGRFSAMTCRIGETCGFHWTTRIAFTVEVLDPVTGEALLRPAP